MPNELYLPALEQSVIKNMMFTRSHEDIARIVEFDIKDVAAVINEATEGTGVVTWQMKLDAIRSNKKNQRKPKKGCKKQAPRPEHQREETKRKDELAREHKRKKTIRKNKC